MEHDTLFSVKKYDTRYDYNFNMYDSMPYVRDVNLCNPSTVRLESGNLIKYWSCNMKKPIPIINKETVNELSKDDSPEDLSDLLWDSKDKRQDAVERMVEMALNNN